MIFQYLLIHDSESIYGCIRDKLYEAANNYIFNMDEFESLYDWVVTQAFIEAFDLRVAGYYQRDRFIQQDIYRCIYDEDRIFYKSVIMDYCRYRGIVFHQNEAVKLMVTYKNIVIARHVTSFK